MTQDCDCELMFYKKLNINLDELKVDSDNGYRTEEYNL